MTTRRQRRRARQAHQQELRKGWKGKKAQREQERQALAKRELERREAAWRAERAREREAYLVRAREEQRRAQEARAIFERIHREQLQAWHKRQRLELGLSHEDYAELQAARSNLVGLLSQASKRLERARRPVHFVGRSPLLALLSLVAMSPGPDPFIYDHPED